MLNALITTLKNRELVTRIGDLDLTLKAFIDEINPHDPELLDKLESVVFGAKYSSDVSESIEKKLGVFALHHKNSRIDTLRNILKTAITRRKVDAKKHIEENYNINANCS